MNRISLKSQMKATNNIMHAKTHNMVADFSLLFFYYILLLPLTILPPQAHLKLTGLVCVE